MIKPTNQPHEIIFNVTDKNNVSRSGEENPEQTILGMERINPFKTSTVIEAQNNLYTNPILEIQSTNLYVKFLPSSMEDLLELENADLEYYDYPLEYEVLTMGDYYQQPIEGTYPILYAVVEMDFEFPNIQYEVIDELYLRSTDPLLITESFRITNNLSQLEDYLPANTGFTILDIGEDAIGRVPNQPDCGPGCTARLRNNNPGGSPSWEWWCDCNPPPPPPVNEYGCVYPENPRYPAGCVRVEDTQLGFQGVRRVKVITKDNWFTQDATWTNDLGCWEITEEYRGKAWMWIKFKNGQCRIRGTQKYFGATYQWLTTVKDYVGKLSGPSFNNITTKYWMWSSKGSSTHIYWGAATVNNALHEFRDYAIQDGINTPPDGLDIYIGRNNKYGYALMGAQYYMGTMVGSAIATSGFFLGPFGYLSGALGAVATVVYLPDMYIGINFQTSDQLKSLAYHEMAHASHYDKVGLAYWCWVVNAEVSANGHGTSSSNGADKIAIVESWAEYLGGLDYAHRTYGPNKYGSYSFATDAEATWNESSNHIPIGLHWDLNDAAGSEPTSWNQDGSGSTIVIDNVSGFSNTLMFNFLGSSTNNINDYKNDLTNNHLNSTPNTSTQVNQLFNSY